jgi:hypothetical protein
MMHDQVGGGTSLTSGTLARKDRTRAAVARNLWTTSTLFRILEDRIEDDISDVGKVLATESLPPACGQLRDCLRRAFATCP